MRESVERIAGFVFVKPACTPRRPRQMKRRKARDMLDKRMRREREPVVLTDVDDHQQVSSCGLGRFVLTFLGECLLVIEKILEVIGKVEDLTQDEMGEIQCPFGIAKDHAQNFFGVHQ